MAFDGGGGSAASSVASSTDAVLSNAQTSHILLYNSSTVKWNNRISVIDENGHFTLPAGKSLVLTDVNGNKWRVVVNSNGTLGTIAYT